MHEKRKKSSVLQTVVFVDRALEAKNAQVPSGKQNFDGRLKPKKKKPNGPKSDKCQQKISKGLSFEGLRASKSGFLKPKCLESFFKNVLPT